jgi:hypothetical protein
MFPDLTSRPGALVVSAELLEDLEHGRGLTKAAVSERRRAAYAWRDLDLATPEIKRLLQGTRRKAREAGRQVNRARPRLVEDFRTLSDAIDRTKLDDLRDFALIALGLVAALRGPSELLALDLGEAKSAGARGALVLKRDGAAIAMKVSKTVQTGESEEVRVEEGPALEAVRAWVQAGGIKAGTPLWRTIHKGHVQHDRMHQRTLQNVVQRAPSKCCASAACSPARPRSPRASTPRTAFAAAHRRHWAMRTRASPNLWTGAGTNRRGSFSATSSRPTPARVRCEARAVKGSACSHCGAKGATLQHPSWARRRVGFEPFRT